MATKDVLLVNQINLDAKAVPAILAGILGISVPMIYQGRQEGKLPGDPDSSYRDCIQHYVQFHKRRSNLKSSSVVERKLIQDIRLSMAKEEMQWLDIKKNKQELIDKQEFARILIPIFNLVRSGLVNITREYPQTQERIDSVMKTWVNLGEQLKELGLLNAETYVNSMLEKEVDIELKGSEESEG